MQRNNNTMLSKQRAKGDCNVLWNMQNDGKFKIWGSGKNPQEATCILKNNTKQGDK